MLTTLGNARGRSGGSRFRAGGTSDGVAEAGFAERGVWKQWKQWMLHIEYIKHVTWGGGVADCARVCLQDHNMLVGIVCKGERSSQVGFGAGRKYAVGS